MIAKQLAGDRTRSSAQRYLTQAVKELTAKELFVYSRVALRFTRKTCKTYGMRRLMSLLNYSERFRVPWSQPDPGPTLIGIPDPDGTLRQKPFAECTREEMAQALLRETPEVVVEKDPEERMPVPSADAECVQLLRDGLHQRLGLRSRTRLMAKMLDGRVHVTLKNVSVEDFGRLVGALLESLDPLYEELHRKDEVRHRPPPRRVPPHAARTEAPLTWSEPPAAAAERRAP